jgi:hypothetical protein
LLPWKIMIPSFGANVARRAPRTTRKGRAKRQLEQSSPFLLWMIESGADIARVALTWYTECIGLKQSRGGQFQPVLAVPWQSDLCGALGVGAAENWITTTNSQAIGGEIPGGSDDPNSAG